MSSALLCTANVTNNRLSSSIIILYPLYPLKLFLYIPISTRRFCLEKYSGAMVIPWSLDELYGYLAEFQALFWEKGLPSTETWIAYAVFFFAQIFLAAIVPAYVMDGLPTAPHGKRLKYYCNGYLTFYICLVLLLVADSTYREYGYGYDLTTIAEHFGEYLIASIIIGDVTSVFWYIYGLVISQPGVSPVTGIIPYDFFMGTCLYPRVYLGFGMEVDIKMIAEARWSWFTLSFTTLSLTLQQYRRDGSVSFQMFTLLVAHVLYTNACVKGEHCIPPTWDMFYEKFGWMLNFWNISGVPFMYVLQAVYVSKNRELISNNFPYDYSMTIGGYEITPFSIFVFCTLIVGYYIFDSANHQKAFFKTKIKRNTFPLVPWSIIEEPVKYIQTPKGKLLVDGWYAFGRLNDPVRTWCQKILRMFRQAQPSLLQQILQLLQWNRPRITFVGPSHGMRRPPFFKRSSTLFNCSLLFGPFPWTTSP